MKPHLEWYFEQTRQFPILDVDEEQRLARRWRDTKDAAAARQLLGSHLRLVVKIAPAGFGGYGMPLADLVAEGNVGLMQALTRFEPERGFRFATYACGGSGQQSRSTSSATARWWRWAPPRHGRTCSSTCAG
jgi:DNA-directed RNA polymerase sigma subunit (sigma70/sigma32)